MEQFIRIRRASKPVELIKFVRLQHDLRNFVCSIYREIDLFLENLYLFGEYHSFGVKVKELKEFSQEETVNELPQPLKQKITEEILMKLRSSNTSSNSTQQRGQHCLIISLQYLSPRILTA